MFKPNKIILHHSKKPDNAVLPDIESIRRYHMSWRYDFQSITEERARELLKEGKPVTRPWDDIGYHAVVEMVKGRMVVNAGRSLAIPGAHCLGQNDESLGICFVGDYDLEEPSPAMLYEGAVLILNLCQCQGIGLTEIYGHRHFAPDRTCPGAAFSVERMRDLVKTLAPEGIKA